MEPIEKLGAFYLGRGYDLQAQQRLADPVMYDARDLTTHAVCVGMTGSGKTGLCIDLLEEAALDGVPAIIVDPKGDITNLLLAFPELRPEDFAPWVNVDDARRKEMTVDAYATHIAQVWREGLADWDQSSARIGQLIRSADFRIYTPGSTAGQPISVLSSLAAPAGDWTVGEEAFREQISGTVSALLGLAGLEADPLRSREHILLTNIFEHEWRQGRGLDLPRLIAAIQNPPVAKLGVLDVETFFPAKDRFALAVALNNIVASPSFSAWLEGDPLAIDALLRTPAGQPRHSIMTIAHLSDAERMFFVTLLLEQIIAWLRQQPGTTSLRALLYIDELFGYLPPVANPPSKKPLLTLLKQARAFGLGVVVTTQNPVDLDYKALTNAGTWLIGKLQTEQDKARLLDGLESAGAGGLDRKSLSRLIAGLGSRVFLLHNVHADEPVVLQTRWAMCYLRGPLTREQIRRLRPEPQRQRTTAAGAEMSAPVTAGPQKTAETRPEVVRAVRAGAESVPAGYSPLKPILPPNVPEVFLPVRMPEHDAVAELAKQQGRPIAASSSVLVYEPALLAQGRVGFVDRRRQIDAERSIGYLIEPTQLGPVIRWPEAATLAIAPNALAERPEPDAVYAPIPAELANLAQIKAAAKDFGDHLYREQTLEIFHCPTLKLYGEAGESARDFRARVEQAVRELRDAEVDKLRLKLRKQMDRLEKRLARERRELAGDKAEHAARQQEEVLSAGETLLGMLGVFGRKSKRGLSSAARKRRMTADAKQDVLESEQEIAGLQQDIAEIKQQMQDEAAAIADKWEAAGSDVETYPIKPRRADIRVEQVALAWSPSWEISFAAASGGQTTARVSAV